MFHHFLEFQHVYGLKLCYMSEKSVRWRSMHDVRQEAAFRSLLPALSMTIQTDVTWAAARKVMSAWTFGLDFADYTRRQEDGASNQTTGRYECHQMEYFNFRRCSFG